MTNLIEQIESLAIKYLTLTGQHLDEIELSPDLHETLKLEVVPYLCSEIPETVECIPMKIGTIRIVVNDKLAPKSLAYNMPIDYTDNQIILTPTQK